MNPLALYRDAALKMCSGFDINKIDSILEKLDSGKMSRYNLFKTFNDNSVEGFNIEVVQNVMLIQDDIMDNAETRRGKPCYHLIAETPLRDSYFLYALQMKMTQNPFIIAENVFKTCLGQFLDLKGGLYTRENYRKICEYKTGYYTIMLPIQLAGVDSPNLERFTQLYGLYYQMVDDALNFNDNEKSATDLEEFKVTWFTVLLKSEFSDEKCVSEYFENKIITPELYELCYNLSKGERFRKELDEILEEIQELLKNDDVLKNAYDSILNSRKSSLKLFS